MYIFITDYNHNYILLKKEMKGMNFIKIQDSEHEHQYEEDVAIALRPVFGYDVEWEIVDVVSQDNPKFIRVVISRYSYVSSRYVWVPLSEYKYTRQINTAAQRLIPKLRLKSKIHSAGIVIRDVEDQNKVLLVRGRLSGKFGIPKGHLMPCEDFILGAIRETFEETGIHFSEMSIAGTGTKFSTLRNTFIFGMTMDASSGAIYQPIDTQEVGEIKWVDRNELSSIQLTKLTKQILVKFR